MIKRRWRWRWRVADRPLRTLRPLRELFFRCRCAGFTGLNMCGLQSVPIIPTGTKSIFCGVVSGYFPVVPQARSEEKSCSSCPHCLGVGSFPVAFPIVKKCVGASRHGRKGFRKIRIFTAKYAKYAKMFSFEFRSRGSRGSRLKIGFR
jgi:hypothetical protein